jgi:hypothetical protein
MARDFDDIVGGQGKYAAPEPPMKCPICDEVPREGETHAVGRPSKGGIEFVCTMSRVLFRPTPAASGVIKL